MIQFFKQKLFDKWKISNHRCTRLKIQKGSLDFLEGADSEEIFENNFDQQSFDLILFIQNLP